MASIVLATPPPGVTTPLLPSTEARFDEDAFAAALAAAISDGLKGGEVLFDLRAIGIAAGDEMRGVFTARSPNKKDHSIAPHALALQPQLAVVLPVIFHRDHREIEDRFEFSKIDSMFAEILAALRFIPREHAGNVDAKCS